MLNKFKLILEYLGGISEEPPAGLPAWLNGPLFWGVWWAILILLVLAFCGQTSKFIYIDF